MIRFFDILFSTIAIILLAPIFLTITLVLFLKQGCPVFFTQIRVGKNQEKFKIFKFRTMVLNKNQSNSISVRTLSDDPRITPVGSLLRKTSLDEIPQFFNVLIGDMSLVGPRPDTIFQENDYSIEDWSIRCSVKPGITGYSQIYGRSGITQEKRIELDLKWVTELNFFNYMRVLFLTPFLMFRNSN